MTAELRAALEAAGFEPDFNVCARCKHHGGDHDLGDWCLLCPRPEMPARPIEARLAAGWCYFASMTEDEKWDHGVARLRAKLAAPREDGAFVATLRAYADRAHDNESYRALVPEHVLRDAAEVIADYRARLASEPGS